MHFAHDVHPGRKGDAYGYLQGLVINGERGSVVDLIGACRLVIQAVGDLLACSELHQCRTVIDAHLTECGPHMADDLRVVFVVTVVDPGRATAEELALRLKLLMNLKTRLEPYPLIIIKRCFNAADITDLLSGLFVIFPRFNYDHGAAHCQCNLSRSAEIWKCPNKESLRNFNREPVLMRGT